VRFEHVPHAVRIAVCICAVAAVTGLIEGLDWVAPILSLGALYLFAVVPIAVAWGLAYGIGTSILCMLAFNFFHLPPLYTFTLTDAENWVALAIFLVTAVVVSELAARVRRRAAEAEQREREEALLADLATKFLQGASVEPELGDLEARVAEVLRAHTARIELGPQRAPPAGESPFELRAGDRRVGTLYLREGAQPGLAIRRRFLPALASLLAVAIDRERLVAESVEAETLRRSDAIKTTVLQAVSHDLQTPLTGILAAAGSLRSESLELDDTDRRVLLETIETQAGRLKELILDLLDLSRLQSGAAVPILELLTVDDLVAQALEDLGPGANRVHASIPDELPLVRADAAQMRRVLANLLENALKFSPPDEEVSVRVTATRKEIILRVVDRGRGMSMEEQKRIFEPFVRAGQHTNVEGSGLGLAIAKGFAEANGGRLWVESRVGQGSSFALALEGVPVPTPVPG
jgi:two-component system, OmpR family, sensor histidine kinase KdpD